MEHFDVLHEDGSPTGFAKPRHQVHQDGDWHRSVHIWVYSSTYGVLLQRRAPDKDSNPDKWDVSCAGHLGAGDTSLQAALRELEEELGLQVEPEKLRFLFTSRQAALGQQETFKDNELQDVYLLDQEVPMETITPQASEVSAVRYFPLPEFFAMVDGEHPELVTHPEEYQRLKTVLWAEPEPEPEPRGQ